MSVSSLKGAKKTSVPRAEVVPNFGIVGDAHAGTERQVSLLPFEAFGAVSQVLSVSPGDFAENITTVGFNISGARIGRRARIGSGIVLEITHIGKECHDGCYIRQVVGDCRMPRKGVFVRVLHGGDRWVGDGTVGVGVGS